MNKTDTQVINGATPQIPHRDTSATSPLFTKIEPTVHAPAAVPPPKPQPEADAPAGEVVDPATPPLKAAAAMAPGHKPS